MSNETEPVGLRMARSPQDEIDRVIRFANELETELKYHDKTNEELGDWVRKNCPPLMRVCFGYQVLVDNCCDPSLDYLALKPELQARKDQNITPPPVST